MIDIDKLGKLNRPILPSVYEDATSYIEEVSYLRDGVKTVAQQSNENKENLNQKVSYSDMVEKYKMSNRADFTGSWWGIDKPVKVEGGIDAVVVKNSDDIEEIKRTIEGLYSVCQFGADKDKTPSENSEALQAAIAYVNSIKGGHIIIPYDINYGYSRNDTKTHPNFEGVTHDIIITDYSRGDTYKTAEQRDGAQVRTFFHTEGVEKDGFHNGNGYIVNGDWHPYFMLMNNAPIGGTDNRRATYWTGNNGEVCWGVGQGTNTIAIDGSNKDDELSDFKIIGNKVAEGGGLEVFHSILKKLGYFGWGIQKPLTEYYFNSKRDSHGQFTFARSIVGNIRVILKTLTKSRRIELFDSDGSIKVTNDGGTANVVEISETGNGYFKGGVSGDVFTSSTRPSIRKNGTMVYDSDLDKPIWFNGVRWNTDMTKFVNKPLTPTDTGNKGDWSADSTHFYICTNTDTWRRVGISTW